LYDGWNLVCEVGRGVSATPSHTNAYFWGLDLSGSMQGAGGIGGLLFSALGESSATSTVCYAYDGNGNVAALFSAFDNANSATYEYGPFGETIRSTGPMGKANAYRFSSKYTDDETGLVYYGHRSYWPMLGRWVNRDPMGEIDHNLYGYVRNSTVDRIDPKGLWGWDVHYLQTRMWAAMEGYQSAAEIAVADADNGVDVLLGPTGYGDYVGQRYHFDRSFGGVDSRLERWSYHFSEAKFWCDWRLRRDVPALAALNLGMALHPQQDWVAHGEYGITSWPLALWHNAASTQIAYGPPNAYPDRPDLDAVGGPRGRPAGPAMVDDYTVATYAPGSQRIAWTESLSRGTFSTYLEHIKDRSQPCGECRRFFLGTD
jgi:RHS repeat-associated protein